MNERPYVQALLRLAATLYKRKGPCKPYDGFHAIKGLSRIYAGLEKHTLSAFEL
ncbi:hypothetical protein L2755_18790 [Shewanella abyssi]|uniref:hypothetical protein n=1 Tax=Shewanella abyssi TaxID=311789 RepID=UPI00200C6C66|nr:hypothetical protein [Shewanella abyssi]MCL1051661.1 hypothetical protein [Shewanella abyssi]